MTDILDRFIEKFKNIFQYFKQRSENKYKGDRFEEWVVTNSNIYRTSSSADERKPFWNLLDWRGDKYIAGYRPLSSSSPDLLLECISESSPYYNKGERIAVECKWRSKTNFFLPLDSIHAYEQYVRTHPTGLSIKSLFYVFGFGWSNGNPESVYVIPANELYAYEKNTIQFPDENTEKKIKRLAKYKSDTPRLLYLPNKK